jgi:hypothetical protein
MCACKLHRSRTCAGATIRAIRHCVGTYRVRAMWSGALPQFSTQSALGLIGRLAQQPDFAQKPADEGVATRALEREHVLEHRRELLA